MAPPRKIPPAKAAPKPPEPPADQDDQDETETDAQRTIREADERIAAAERGEPDPHPEPPEPPSEEDIKRREREADLRERELALAERERSLAARESAAGAAAPPVDTGPPAVPEFLLTLANGEQVEAPGAQATHHFHGGKLHRVVSADPLPEEYGVPQDVRDRRERERDRRERAAARS